MARDPARFAPSFRRVTVWALLFVPGADRPAADGVAITGTLAVAGQRVGEGN
jgi:hypothetical protein